MYSVESEFSFDSAHFLKDHPGKCRFIHGHRWRVVVQLSSEELKDDMIMDFTDFKAELKRIEEIFDHTFIIQHGSISASLYAALENEGFRILEMQFRPTAENFARYFYVRFNHILGHKVTEVTVYETPNNKATYKEK